MQFLEDSHGSASELRDYTLGYLERWSTGEHEMRPEQQARRSLGQRLLPLEGLTICHTKRETPGSGTRVGDMVSPESGYLWKLTFSKTGQPGQSIVQNIAVCPSFLTCLQGLGFQWKRLKRL